MTVTQVEAVFATDLFASSSNFDRAESFLNEGNITVFLEE